jgi:AcrR family transcriptional regulator
MMPDHRRPEPGPARPFGDLSVGVQELLTQRRRERILAAAVQLIDERGYLETPLAEVAIQARMAWPTLSRTFASKEEVYLAAFDQSVELATAYLDERVSREQPGPERIREAIETLGTLLSAEPRRGRLCLLHYQSAGPRARQRYEALIARLACALRDARGSNPRSAAPFRREEQLVAGLASLVAAALADDEFRRLRELVPEMVELALQSDLSPVGRVGEGSRPTARRTRPPGDTSARTGAASKLALLADLSGQAAEPQAGSEGQPSSVDRLPSGRHGLSREFVLENQRERLIRGFLLAVAEHGYAEVTFEEINANSRVSSATFYELFDSKEACCLASYELFSGYLREAITAAVGQRSRWPDQVVAAVEAALDFLAASPEVARFLTLESAVPQKGAARCRDSLRELIPGLKRGRRQPKAKGLPESAEEVLLAGVAFVLSSEVSAGRATELPALVPEIAALLLGPYLGFGEAANLVHDTA